MGLASDGREGGLRWLCCIGSTMLILFLLQTLTIAHGGMNERDTSVATYAPP